MYNSVTLSITTVLCNWVSISRLFITLLKTNYNFNGNSLVSPLPQFPKLELGDPLIPASWVASWVAGIIDVHCSTYLLSTPEFACSRYLLYMESYYLFCCLFFSVWLILHIIFSRFIMAHISTKVLFVFLFPMVWTQGFGHSRQVHCHWATPPTLLFVAEYLLFILCR